MNPGCRVGLFPYMPADDMECWDMTLGIVQPNGYSSAMAQSTRADHTKSRFDGALFGSDHKINLAVFAFNASNGSAMTTAEGHVEADWDEQIRIAKAAEHANLDALIPVARWKGHGGDTNFNHRSFETLTWAAGLAAATERIQVFATTHVPTIHPVRAAKQIATADHISRGRIGLNVVAGWNPGEMAMFGLTQREHDERYDVAEEWLELMIKLWNEDQPFDFRGKYFDAPGAYSSPKPVQQHRPLTMSAGTSPRGQLFAAQHADMIFVIEPSSGDFRGLASKIKQKALDFGNEVKVFLGTHVIIGDTDAEARAYRDYYVNKKGDWSGAQKYLDTLIAGAALSKTPEEWRQMREHAVAGAGSTELIGSPETIGRRIGELSDAGIDGLTLSFVDYESGIDRFREQVYPLLVEAGLRAG
jgi:FMNH2-dependent dimethyl sulfone monooxygenase